MPDLIIDGRPVTVAPGTKVIEAAEALGIMIPRFCWHPALGAAGACRMCAVMFLEGPVKGLEMSCMVPAADGMVVETFHPEAVAFRRRIIEMLMANHPHDCPVCDEGGHCLLQDETISGNHALRRFPGPKRTYLDQDLGPFIQHEMNRCIHCYRCARFYQDYCGYHDFGPMQNANRVYFGRFESGPLENPFSGNLADICPTGTLTDKPGRYTSRRWDCQRAPSVCPHCSLGCNTIALSRYREVVRTEARENPAVNGCFICDRGRYSFGYAGVESRPRTARVDGSGASPAAALEQAARRLAAIAATHGAQAVAVVGSQRSSLEAQCALTALARAAGWREPAFFPDRQARADVAAALAALTPGRVRSLAEVGRADAALCLGVSPLDDAPMLALALRQASRADGTVVVADPRPQDLPLPRIHLPLAPSLLPAVAAIVAGPAEAAATEAQKRLPQHPDLWPRLQQAAEAFATAKRPVVVFAPALARHLPESDRIGRFPVLAGPNTAGAALVSEPDAPGWDELARAIETGEVKGLVVAEADLSLAAPALADRLDRLDTLVVCDYLATPTVAAAHVFLPTQTLFEAGGLLVNSEGRAQAAAPVAPPGLSVVRDGHGDHPPRDFARPLPGTDPRPGAALCAALADGLGLAPDAPTPESVIGRTLATLPPEGARVDCAVCAESAATAPTAAPPPAGQGLAVVFVDTLFGTEELGRHAPLARAQAPAETPLLLAAAEAAALSLTDGAPVSVAVGDTLVQATVRLRDDVARGVIVVPRLPQFTGLPPILEPCDLRRRES